MPSNIVTHAPIIGLARFQKFTDYNYSTTYGNHGGVGVLFPGQIIQYQGTLFQAVQNRSGGTLALGDTVSLNLGDATRTGNLATGTTAANLLTDDTHDTDMTGSESWPTTVGITAGALATTDDMQVRQVLSNVAASAASTLRVAKSHFEDGNAGTDITSVDIFTGTLDNTYDYEMLVPYEVVKTDLDALTTSAMQGVVVSTTITDNFFGIIQISGVALAKVDGTTDVAAGSLLIPSGTAGILKQHALTDNNAVTIGAEELNISFVCARAIGAFTDNATGLRQVILRPPFLHIPYPIF